MSLLLTIKHYVVKILFIFVYALYLITGLYGKFTPKSQVNFTLVSSFMLSTYVFISLTIITVHAIKPSLICDKILYNLKLIETTNGKVILVALIALLYIGSDNAQQVVFGTVTLFVMAILYGIEELTKCDVSDMKRCDDNVARHVMETSEVGQVVTTEEKKEESKENVEVLDSTQ